MIYRYFIKRHHAKNWTKMSLSTKVLISNEEAHALVKQWACDRLAHLTDYEFRAVDEHGNEHPFHLVF